MEAVRKAGSPLAFSCSSSVQSTLASDRRVMSMRQCNFATSKNSKKNSDWRFQYIQSTRGCVYVCRRIKHKYFLNIGNSTGMQSPSTFMTLSDSALYLWKALLLSPYCKIQKCGRRTPKVFVLVARTWSLTFTPRFSRATTACPVFSVCVCSYH